MYYSQIVDPLLIVFPELRKKNKKSKYLVAKAFSATSRHKDDSEAYVFSNRYFDKLGHDPTKARKLLADLGLFTFAEFSYFTDQKKGRRTAQKVYPTELFHQFNDWLDDATFELWDQCQNKPATASPNIITVDSVSIEGMPKVNLDNLKHFIKKGYKEAKKKDGPRRDKHLWRSRARSMWRFATAPNAKPGHLPQSFILNDRTHRIQATSACVQNCHKLLRNAMFDGYTDVDIANCHYSTLAQIAPGPTLKLYAEEPTMVREKVASDIGSNPDAVKTSLLAMLYGGQPGGEGYTGIHSYLGTGTQSEFWRHDLVSSLRAEIKAAKKSLGYDSNKDFSCYLMQQEQRIVRAMARGITIATPMHDGFIVSEPVNTEAMQKQVKKETQFLITITTKRITYHGLQNTE